jgi:D-alanine-D-alanine ligase
MTTGRERLPEGLSFPCMVKPVAEGSSRGVTDKSVVQDEAELRRVVPERVAHYRQPMLVEGFLSGREFTLGLLGPLRADGELRVLPPLEVVFTDPAARHPVYGFDNKFYSKGIEIQVPARVAPDSLAELSRVARGAFEVLGCRDVGRVDLRLDAAGQVSFIECNPLPGLAPDFSDLCLIAKAAGFDYHALIGAILAPALGRMETPRTP